MSPVYQPDPLHQLEEHRGQQVRQAGLEARPDLRMHLPERYRAGLLPLLIIDQHRGQRALRNLKVVTPLEKAFPRFGALPGSGDVIQDPVPALVSDSQQIAAVEGIGAEVALVQEPAPGHHPPVVQSGVGVNEPASDRAIPVGADDQVEVQGAAGAKMQRRAVRPRVDQLDGRAAVRGVLGIRRQGSGDTPVRHQHLGRLSRRPSAGAALLVPQDAPLGRVDTHHGEIGGGLLIGRDLAAEHAEYGAVGPSPDQGHVRHDGRPWSSRPLRERGRRLLPQDIQRGDGEKPSPQYEARSPPAHGNAEDCVAVYVVQSPAQHRKALESASLHERRYRAAADRHAPDSSWGY